MPGARVASGSSTSIGTRYACTIGWWTFGSPPGLVAPDAWFFTAFDARTGHVLWTHRAGGTISGAPSLIGRIVYFSTLSKRTTTGLNARTGRVVWTFGRGAFNPAISDGLRLYITGYSSLYAFKPRNVAR